MKKLPELRVEGLGWEIVKETYRFEESQYFPYDNHDLVIVVEGEVVRDYKDLVKLAEREDNKKKPILEVKFLPVIVGG